MAPVGHFQLGQSKLTEAGHSLYRRPGQWLIRFHVSDPAALFYVQGSIGNNGWPPVNDSMQFGIGAADAAAAVAHVASRRPTLLA